MSDTNLPIIRPGGAGMLKCESWVDGVKRITDYAPQYLKEEACRLAKSHALANGGGRPVNIVWSIGVHAHGASLRVFYHCNRPDGHCGRYETSEAL